MSFHEEILFSSTRVGRLSLPNRLMRSATYEGMADTEGVPDVEKLSNLYATLARAGTGTIITGFCYVTQQGRAMHPRQAGIDRDELVQPWREIRAEVAKANPATRLVMQIAHCGRQTNEEVTGMPVVGAGPKRCPYFRQRVVTLTEKEIFEIIHKYALATRRAREAGFDAVQIHCAHGYLIHQFLSPDTNQRQDAWGDPVLFLCTLLEEVSKECGSDFPLLLKVSHADDRELTIDHTINTVKAAMPWIDAVEISYGTMERALNIFRGDCPIDLVLRINPMFNRIPRLLKSLWKAWMMPGYIEHLHPFEENYNLAAARTIAAETAVPVIPVGGIRSLNAMSEMVNQLGFPAIALSRPLIAEPDLAARVQTGRWERSACVNCNHCAIYCDSDHSLRCYMKTKLYP